MCCTYTVWTYTIAFRTKELLRHSPGRSCSHHHFLRRWLSGYDHGLRLTLSLLHILHILHLLTLRRLSLYVLNGLLSLHILDRLPLLDVYNLLWGSVLSWLNSAARRGCLV